MKINMKKVTAVLTISALLAGVSAPFSTSYIAKAATTQSDVVQKTKRNVMYYGDWSIWGGQGNFYPQGIPADQLTHLNYAFMDFDANGELAFTDTDAAVTAPVGQAGVGWGDPNSGLLNAIQDLRAKNPNLKIGISLGGWSKSGDFSTVSADPTKRANLVNNVMKFIKYTNMDFVDVDWEFPTEVRKGDLVDNKNDEGTPNATPQDKVNYITLLKDLRAALDKQGTQLSKTYELSVALPAPKQKIDDGIDVNALFNVIDFANIMSYDMRGAWDSTSGHHAGLYGNPNDPNKGNNLSVDESVNYLIQKGAKPDKIVIGAAYYTRGWNQVDKGPDPKTPGLFGKAELNAKDADQTPSYGAVNEAPMAVGDAGRRSGVWSYRSLDKLKAAFPGITEYWDDIAKAPYLYDAKTGAFFTYDNVRSIQEKTKYVNAKNLGGMIAWMASQDASTTNPAVNDELTKTSKNGLFGSAALPKYDIKYAALNVTTTITPYEEAWGATPKGYDISFTNNEKLEESSKVLSAVEVGAETIKFPKLYIKTDKALGKGDSLSGAVTYENGYTVVDLQSVYEGKNIKPGQKYTLRVTGDAAIQSIELVQRMSQTSPDMNRQTIFGSTTTVNQAPVFNGVTDTTLTVGDTFDAKAGVTATDKEDGDLTSRVTITGSVDTSKVGTYSITYTVTDSKGVVTTKTRIVTVKDKTVVPNEAPVLNGVTDTSITVGDVFNAKTGITATDKEDGDLTAKIAVTGTVDTTKAGAYTLTYSVTDSKGTTTTKARIVTVKDKSTTPTDTFDPAKIYNTGDKVIYKGVTYTAQWWTQGGTPDTNAAWKKSDTTNPDGSVQYVPGNSYNAGAVVSYNGKVYVANWWTNTVPGSDGSWKLK